MTAATLNVTKKIVFLCDPSGVWKTKDGEHLVRVESGGGVPLPDVSDDAIFTRVTLHRVSGRGTEVYEGLRLFSVIPKRNFILHVVSIMPDGGVEVMLSVSKRVAYAKLYGGINI